MKDKNKILELRNQGLNCREIAAIVGGGANNINKILRQDFGVKVLYPFQNRKYDINEHFLDNINEEFPAYFLGLMYADGTVSKKTQSSSVALVESDKEILQLLSNYIQPTKPLSDRKQNRGENLKSLTINSKKFKNRLIELGCIPNKTYSLKWPTYINDNGIKHFLRGYFDGDGCFYVNKNNASDVCFNITGYKDIINSLKIFLEENLKINCSIRTASKTGHKDIMSLNVYGARQVEMIGNFIYSNFNIALKRKYQKYLLIKNRPNKRIFNG